MSETIIQGVAQRAADLRLVANSPEGFDLAAALRAAAALRDQMATAARLQWEEAFDNRIDDYNHAGQLCQDIFDVAIQAFDAVKGRAEFGPVVADIQALRNDFVARWPWFDEGKLMASIALERQGVRGRTLKEVHNELRRRIGRFA